jgi:heme/copper-type cytochrome/quinol oxidase subunit 1
MTIPKRLSRPEFQFLALAVCLLPLGILTFHSSWPPWGWMRVHFAEGDIGETILACSGLFFVFALAYFFFGKIFHRRMNRALGQFHFWLNVTAFLVLLALPIYFNLVFQALPDETKLGRGFRAFGYAMESFFLGIEVLGIVQILFLANVLWSVFKGERTSGPTMLEPFPLGKKRKGKNPEPSAPLVNT